MSAADVRDILELNDENTGAGIGLATKASIIKQGQTRKSKKTETVKRPEGMHRELFALLYSDNRDPAPLIPTDTSQTYQTAKAKLGCSQVRPWKWMPFTNPGRKDGAVFHHWRRAEDEGKDYPFAKFNKTINIPVYSDQEYQLNLAREDWTREETDHLFELCRRFDLRWFIVNDRYDNHRFSQQKRRTIEDMKERYYFVCNELTKMRSTSGQPLKELYVYDAEHETRRKEQLERLFSRTKDQVEEEEMLLQELKKIDTRKKERERKAQDLQKLIAAADSGADGVRRAERKSSKKKVSQQNVSKKETPLEIKNPEVSSVIKFPDYKAAGVMLRSQRMKLPSSVAQKKVKAVEQLLTEFNIDLHPMPTRNITNIFNDLRSDMVLLYDLRMAHVNLQMELQTLRYKWDALAPGRIQSSKSEVDLIKTEDIPVVVQNTNTQQETVNVLSDIKDMGTDLGTTTGSDSNDVIDVVSPTNTAVRKRYTQLQSPPGQFEIKKHKK